jgi:hypothetical protein
MKRIRPKRQSLGLINDGLGPCKGLVQIHYCENLQNKVNKVLSKLQATLFMQGLAEQNFMAGLKNIKKNNTLHHRAAYFFSSVAKTIQSKMQKTPTTLQHLICGVLWVCQARVVFMQDLGF